MAERQEKLFEILQDLVKLNAIIATELIQLVENSSRTLRGDIPDSCRAEHGRLRVEIVEIAGKWNPDCETLRQHNLDHS